MWNICASIIINQVQPKEYHNINWKYLAKPEEVLVVHLTSCSIVQKT